MNSEKASILRARLKCWMSDIHEVVSMHDRPVITTCGYKLRIILINSEYATSLSIVYATIVN